MCLCRPMCMCMCMTVCARSEVKLYPGRMGSMTNTVGERRLCEKILRATGNRCGQERDTDTAEMMISGDKPVSAKIDI